jgi:cytochrome P450
MADNPCVTVEAQAEIDVLTGNSRLPDVADRAELPFLEAVIKETFRWCPTLPLSIARRAKEASQYKSFCVPEKTIISPNVWYVPPPSS